MELWSDLKNKYPKLLLSTNFVIVRYTNYTADLQPKYASCIALLKGKDFVSCKHSRRCYYWCTPDGALPGSQAESTTAFVDENVLMTLVKNIF